MAEAGQASHEAGQRAAVLYLCRDGASKTSSLLAQDYHLLMLASDAAKSFVDARGGTEKFSIIAQGAAAEQAITLAVANPERVESIALIAPPLLEGEGIDALAKRWGETKTSVMALFGTKDFASPPSSGSAYRRAIPRCNVMFVYDAGSDMANERPEAVTAVLREFLHAKDRFVVSRASGVLYP